MTLRVLGLSLGGHGAAMCLVEDGRVTRAVNLERITGKKFATIASKLAIDAIRGKARSRMELAYSEIFFEPNVALPMMLEYLTGERDPHRAEIGLVLSPHEATMGLRTIAKRDLIREVRDFFRGIKRNFATEHHLLHAYQAFLPSPFDEAAVLTIDGQGDELDRYGTAISMSLGVTEGARVRVLAEVPLPSTVGGLYYAVTRHLGFGNEQEGNTMALAAFGTPAFYETVKDTLQLDDDGTFRFLTDPQDRLTHGFFFMHRVFGACPPRARHEPITELHKDIAFAVQKVTENVVLNAARALHARTGQKRLVMAGGVALNCVTNAKILTETPFEDLYVAPNAGDRGLSLGAAMYGNLVVLGKERMAPGHDYLGKTYGEDVILTALRNAPHVEYRRSQDIARECARLLAAGRIIGWVQGGAEFGPRALGHRSILADPRTDDSKRRLDKDIKRREWFRPYGPSVLSERAEQYFEMHGSSPYMLQAVKARALAHEKTPGIVHVDGTARVQTVHRERAPLFHELILRFEELTGVPVVLNTSFNGYSKPMVETPADALREQPRMSLDAVAIGSYIAWNAQRDPFQSIQVTL